MEYLIKIDRLLYDTLTARHVSHNIMEISV